MSEKRLEKERATVRVYRADNRFADSSLAAFSHLTREIWRHRAHVGLMFKRDFRAAYRGTVLGTFWNFVLPLLPVSVYVFLSVVGVFPAVEHLPRAVYVSFNVSLWLLFSGLVEKPIQVVKMRNSDAMKTSLPISVAIASGLASLSFEILLRSLLVAGLVLAYLVPVTSFGFLALLVVLVGAIFCLSIGLLFAIANIVLPDTQSVVTIVMRYGIFMSGVIFPLSAIEPLRWLEVVNPFAVLIQAARELAFTGQATHPVALAAVAAVTILLMFFSARVFYLMEYRIRGVV
jgi:ABC-type polysaccharide/polyol phosphate export permease